MLIKILPYLIILTSILYTISVILHKLYISKQKDNLKASSFVAFIAGMLFLYIILCIALAIFSPVITKKIILLLFAISPFIIGKLATYEKEKLYSIIQIVIMLISSCVVIFY